MNQSKLTDLTVENILFTGVSMKMQITDSISENLTNSDLESGNSSEYFYHFSTFKLYKSLLYPSAH